MPTTVIYNIYLLEALALIPIMACAAYWVIRKTVQIFKRQTS